MTEKPAQKGSLPHFPFDVTTYYVAGHHVECENCCDKNKWKKEHEKFDDEREKELKETQESYVALFKTNLENYEALDKLRVDVRAFCEWLESSGLLIESFESEYKKYLKKKKSLLGSDDNLTETWLKGTEFLHRQQCTDPNCDCRKKEPNK